MTKLFRLTSFALILGFCSVNVALADPLTVTGNSFQQNRIGTSLANQALSNIFNSTVANGSAGNTFTVLEAKSGDGFATIVGNSVLQQEIGTTNAYQEATNIISSSVGNHGAGNAITFSGQ